MFAWLLTRHPHAAGTAQPTVGMAIIALQPTALRYSDCVSWERIAKASASGKAPPENSKRDEGWVNTETLEIGPNPQLNARQREIVAKEYAMKSEGNSFIWRLSLRQCMIGYFARRYGLDVAGTPDHKTHHLVLKNKQALKKYFLGDAAG